MKRFFILTILFAMSLVTTFAQTTIKHHGEFNCGYSVGVGSYAVNRVNAHTIQGVKIGDHFSVGLGLGLDWYRGIYAEYWEKQGLPDMGELAMPFYLNLKTFLPTNGEAVPYLSFDIGYGIGITEGLEGFGGLYINPSAGMMLGKFKFEMGFNIQRIVDQFNVNANAVKLSIGYIF